MEQQREKNGAIDLWYRGWLLFYANFLKEGGEGVKHGGDDKSGEWVSQGWEAGDVLTDSVWRGRWRC
jgi:hypothetical protein